MVLKNRDAIRSFMWIFLFLLTQGVWAGIAGITQIYVVQRNTCPVKVKWRWKGDWKPYDKLVPLGMRVTGVRPAEKPDVVLFQLPGSEDFYVASWRCMFAESVAEMEIDKKTYSGWHLSLGLLSWEERFNYEAESGQKYPLRANALGVCPGNGYLIRVHHFDLGFSGCVGIARAFVQSQGASLSYSHRNLTVASLLAGPLGLWRPAAGNVAFGLYLPIMPRLVFWPQPDNAKVGKRIRYLFGLMGEIRIERQGWSISQRVGTLGSLRDISYYFSFNKDFR